MNCATQTRNPLLILGCLLIIGFSQTAISQSNNCNTAPSTLTDLPVLSACLPRPFITRWWWSASTFGTCNGGGPQRQDGWFVMYGTGNPVTITITGSSHNFCLAAFTGCGGVGEVACTWSNTGTGSIVFPTTYGTPYFIYINRRSGGGWNVHTGNICATSANVPNDDPCGAIPLAVGATCTFITGTNSPATDSGLPNPGCANYQGNDVWFSMVVPASGDIAIDTEEHSFYNSGIALYNGPCGALTQIACNDDDGSGTMSYIFATGLTPGATVYLQVWEKSNDQFGGIGICVKDNNACSSPPNEDYCNAPATLIQGPGNFISSTYPYYTSDTPGNLNAVFCGTIENNSWYQFVATATTATFPFSSVTGCVNGDGIQAHVYEVTNGPNGCCNNFTSRSNCWNPATPTSGNVNAVGLTIGNTYILMVDGYAADNCVFQVDGWVASGIQLPVELVQFHGVALPESNIISWKTISERDNDYFNLQRSYDGQTFENIAKIYGAGTTTETTNYSFEDLSPRSGTAYYRIEQVDYNGAKTLIDPISLNRISNEVGIVNLYPNPATENVTVMLNLETKEYGMLEVKSTDGTIVLVKQTYGAENNRMTLDLSSLSSGVYFVTYQDSQVESVKRLIKQ
ncbi:MAG: T9SS type A sorting domain-containing protein [Crocinitomicaceae bacterium]|nr:T9SS type A sorting domain-containing protein [Crocinitomicaceae bacterium]